MAEKVLAKIVGEDNVLSLQERLNEYSKDMSFVAPMKPDYIIKPGNTSEVQKVVQWANIHQRPLVTVSSGPPHLNGDTVPGTKGAVILDLHRMNRIIKIDPANQVAIVEPGVTYQNLQVELKKSGLRAFTPLVPRIAKSVIGSIISKEPVTIPSQHWDSTDPMLCIEVVFGTGDKTRTGEAAGPDPLEKQWEIGKAQLSPFGPTQMDLQRLISGAQGTIGIVTWMSIKCRQLPKLSRGFFVPSERIEPLIELSYELLRPRMGEDHFIVNGLNLACLMSCSSQEIQYLSKTLPSWLMFINFEGYDPLPLDAVEYQTADLIEMAQCHGLSPVTEIQGITAEKLIQLLSEPSPEPYWKFRSKGGFQDVPFLTTLDQTPDFGKAMFDLAEKYQYPTKNIGVYIQPIVQGTCCQCEFSLFHDPTDPDASAHTKQFLNDVVECLEQRGGFFSRPYAVWADIAYRHMQDTADIQKKIKKIFDPNGILNPGKLCFNSEQN